MCSLKAWGKANKEKDYRDNFRMCLVWGGCVGKDILIVIISKCLLSQTFTQTISCVSVT